MGQIIFDITADTNNPHRWVKCNQSQKQQEQSQDVSINGQQIWNKDEGKKTGNAPEKSPETHSLHAVNLFSITSHITVHSGTVLQSQMSRSKAKMKYWLSVF